MSSTPQLFDVLSFEAIQAAFPSPHPAIGAGAGSSGSGHATSDQSPSSSLSASAATSASQQEQSGRRHPHNPGETPAKKQRKRKRNFSSADRVVHSVIEKRRREAFNENLQTLAELIPELQGVPASQLFKTVVVNASASYHRRQSGFVKVCLDEIEALQRKCHNLRQTVSLLSGCAHTTSEDLGSSAFKLVQSEIRKDHIALESSCSGRARSASSARSLPPSDIESQPLQVADSEMRPISESGLALDQGDQAHRAAALALDLPDTLFHHSALKTPATAAVGPDFAQIIQDGQVSAFESILPKSRSDALPAFLLPGEVTSQATEAMPFPWQSFSPDNFFYRQLLEARTRT